MEVRKNKKTLVERFYSLINLLWNERTGPPRASRACRAWVYGWCGRGGGAAPLSRPTPDSDYFSLNGRDRGTAAKGKVKGTRGSVDSKRPSPACHFWGAVFDGCILGSVIMSPTSNIVQ